MIKRIFWDFDGVIVDSVSLKTRSFKEIYAEYGEEVSSKVENYHLQNGGVSRYRKFKYWHKHFLNKELTNLELDDLANRFSKLVLDKVISSSCVAGFHEFMLDRPDISHIIVTGTPQKEIDIICEKMGIKGFFDEIWGTPTNKIEWLKVAKQKFGEIKNDSLFIGDSSTDKEAADFHEVKFVLRNTEENGDIFSDFSGMRVNNFLNFDSMIKGIE